MKSKKLEEKLTLLEQNKYPEVVGRPMMNDCLDILVNYSGSDFDKQMNRYLILSRGKIQ